MGRIVIALLLLCGFVSSYALACEITRVSPNSAAQGETLSVEIYGLGLLAAVPHTILFGAGIEVQSFQLSHPSGENELGSLTALVSIRPDAPLGARDVMIFGFDANCSKSAGFSVIENPQEPRRPVDLLSREEAISIVREHLSGNYLPGEFAACMPEGLLDAGATVTPAHEGGLPAGIGRQVSLQSPSWLVFVDRVPTGPFAHPVEYLFLNAATGAIDQQIGAEWWPVVNGEPMFASCADSPQRIEPPLGQDFWPSLDSPQLDESDKTLARDVHPPDIPGDCLTQWAKNPNGNWKVAVLIQTSPGEAGAGFHENVDKFDKLLQKLGFNQRFKIPSVAERDRFNESPYAIDLSQAMSNAKDFLAKQGLGPCHKVMLYLTGHGGSSGLSWWRSRSKMFRYAYELEELLESTRAGYVNVMIDSCYSGSAIRAVQDWFKRKKPSQTINVSTSASDACEARASSDGGAYTLGVIQYFNSYLLYTSDKTGRTYLDLSENGALDVWEVEGGFLLAHIGGSTLGADWAKQQGKMNPQAQQATLKPEASGRKTASTLGQFDANHNCMIDDSEMFQAVDDWISAALTNELFFLVVDHWIDGSSVCPTISSSTPGLQRTLKVRYHPQSNEFMFENAPKELGRLRLEVFDLNGHMIFAKSSSASRLKWSVRSSRKPVAANGVYLYRVSLFDQHGKTTQLKVGRIAIIR